MKDYDPHEVLPLFTNTAAPQWQCVECGSRDIQATAWITLNDETVVPGEGPTDQVWCPVCEIDCADIKPAQ